MQARQRLALCVFSSSYPATGRGDKKNKKKKEERKEEIGTMKDGLTMSTLDNDLQQAGFFVVQL
jgi:hypothetical protein